MRVTVIADLLEEGWPSMDLVADMLMAHLGRNGLGVSPHLCRPSFPLRVPQIRPGAARRPLTIERIAHRFWDYPRWLRAQHTSDVYHIVDHSYSHLAYDLPDGRVITTCHDTDAFRGLLRGRRESNLPRIAVKRVLGGLRRAAFVACDSESTRADLVDHGFVPRERTCVVPLGVHPACSAAPDRESDVAAAGLIGTPTSTELLHVGSTIPRKRIDVLLDTFARIASVRQDARLWRVGGAFTPAQATRVIDLGLQDRVTVLPFVSRPVLAALYRRAALVLLPSEREGFGLPVLEAMACGTPVVASDLPVLRDVGGNAAEYCPVGAPEAWAASVLFLLDQRKSDPEAWQRRRTAGVVWSQNFTWARYARGMEQLYLQVAEAGRRQTC